MGPGPDCACCAQISETHCQTETHRAVGNACVLEAEVSEPVQAVLSTAGIAQCGFGTRSLRIWLAHSPLFLRIFPRLAASLMHE